MPKLSDLVGLDQSAGEIDFANLPEQFGIRTPIPQPGAGYVFRMPSITQDDDNWIANLQNGDSQPRIGYSFNDGKELVLLALPGTTEGVGNPVRFRLTNIERKFDEAKSAASPMAHLFAHSFSLDLTGKKNVDYVKALLAISGMAFGATVNWTARCSPDRDIYRPEDEENGVQAGVVEGHKGCGQRYALKQRTNKKSGEVTLAIPRGDTGQYLSNFLCATPNCPALISCFVELQNFQPAPDDFKHLKAAVVKVTKGETVETKAGGNGATPTTHDAEKPAAKQASAKPAVTASAKQA